MHAISPLGLAVSLTPIALVIFIVNRWEGEGGKILVAAIRMLVQLLAVGYILKFVLLTKDPLVGLVVIGVMIVAAGFISIRTVSKNRKSALMRAIAGIGGGGGAALAFSYIFGLQLGLVYEPTFIIPLAGMVFSNAMIAIALAADRMQRETEMGATYNEARNAAFRAALIPQINVLLAVGLVSLPGMMSGQILSGVDPLVAVRYQIVVMSLLLQSAAFSTALYLAAGDPRRSASNTSDTA